MSAPKWTAALPFFVVLRDNSRYVLPQTPESSRDLAQTINAGTGPSGAGGSGPGSGSGSGAGAGAVAQPISRPGSRGSRTGSRAESRTASPGSRTASQDGGNRARSLISKASRDRLGPVADERATAVDRGGFLPTTMYPDVHYVFADDDFNPVIDALDHEDGDISVIVDFDSSGDKVVGYKSLSPTWQVTNVSIDSGNSTPSWIGDESLASKKLFVDGTGNHTTTLRRQNDLPDPMAEIQQLMQAVQDRSSQLRQLLYHQEE